MSQVISKTIPFPKIENHFFYPQHKIGFNTVARLTTFLHSTYYNKKKRKILHNNVGPGSSIFHIDLQKPEMPRNNDKKLPFFLKVFLVT